MNETPQEVPTSTILDSLHSHIIACSKAESSLKGMVGEMVGAGNGQGQPNPGLIIPGRPTTPPNGPNERQISATSLQAEALLLQGQRLLALAVGTLLDKQEHATPQKADYDRDTYCPLPHRDQPEAEQCYDKHKQEHGTSGKVVDERGSQSPEAV